MNLPLEDFSITERGAKQMNWGLLRKLIALPGMVVAAIPGVILHRSSGTSMAPNPVPLGSLPFWMALFLAGAGLWLSVVTVTLFIRYGEGTPAPWEPPQKLVIRGPYRYVRNPMIIGVLFVLMAQALFFQSPPLLLWAVVFFSLNAIYFPLLEEKGLEKRFGDDYREYKAHVPRWILRRKPWKNKNQDRI